MNKKLFFKFFSVSLTSVLILFFIITAVLSAGEALYYYKILDDNVKQVSESDFITDSNYVSKFQNSNEINFEAIENILKTYYGQLSVNRNRSVYIIKSDDLKIAVPTSLSGESIESSENIVSAASGKDGNKYRLFKRKMDAAYPIIIDNTGYILYVNDNMADLRGGMFYNIKFYFMLLLFCVLTAFVISFLITKRLDKSIKKITNRAEGFKKGELSESFGDVKESDFPKLVESVNHMGYVMAESIQRMNSDKHRIELIIEHINNGIITFDNNQNVIQINSAAKRILKIKDEKPIKFDELFKNSGIDVRMAEFSYLEKSASVQKEITKDGGHIKVWFIPFKMDTERYAGVVCVLEDVTEQFNVMSAMRKFVADVSHELKTPITVISSYTETVLNSYLDDKAMTANLLNIVYQEAGKMTELVQNLLDISRYEMKTMPRKEENFSIDDMINSLVKTFKLQTEKKELDLKYTRMTEIPEFKGSRSDIERAVKNIISNSIKYTSRGDKIRIFAGRLRNDIYIKVEDTGWGIPESKLGHLFERFYRVEEEARSRDKGGTGLGLSIAKEIIESYGGNIKIESEYTKYTRVTITLPVPDLKKIKKGE